MRSLRSFLSFAIAAAILSPSLAFASTLSVEAMVLANPRDGSAEVTALVRNAEDAAVVLAARPDWNAAGGLTVKITSPDGTVSTLAPTETTADSDDYTLEGNTSLGLSRTIPAGTFAASGVHEVIVEFAGPGGAVASEPVTISIGQ